MYVPPHFKETDMTRIKEFIRAHGFATVFSTDSGRPVASHLLVDLREDAAGKLLLAGHIARGNPLWTTFSPENEVLVVFLGAHSYISPTWYHAPAVPTWNYSSVHAYGSPRIIDEREKLEEILARLVDAHEATNSPGRRFKLSEFPRERLDQMIRRIVGFEITVTRIEMASKLSQNSSPEDFESIIVRLRERGNEDSHEVADAMERIRREGRKR